MIIYSAFLEDHTYLTDSQENQLAQWIANLASIGYGKTKNEIIKCVKEVLDKSGSFITKFKNNMPSSSWIFSFLRCHPELSSRFPEALGLMCASVSNCTIIKWFCVLSKFLEDEHGVNKQFFSNKSNSYRVFNLNETG